MSSLKFFCFLSTIAIVKGLSYRLPNDVEPISYDLRIAPNPENSTFAGEVNIRVHVKFTTNQIILNSRDLEIRNVTLNKLKDPTNDTATNAASHTLDKNNQIIIIERDGKFEYNKDYIVSITFLGALLDHFISDPFTQGFYRYPDPYHNESWGASTFLEPTGARTVFPCFDEPRYRVPFNISLARPENYTAVSNMPSEAVLPPDSLSNGFIWEKFQPTPPMPTYLVAFMVSNFKSLKSEHGRLRAMARPHLIHQASYVLKQSELLLKYYEGYTGIPYSLPKLDIVAVPMTGDPMENWGLIIYKEDEFLLSDTDSLPNKFNISTSTSHELAHLWFGDIVTIAWYDYLWLKEGFATYFTYFGVAAIEPTWDMESMFVIYIVHDTLKEETIIEAPIMTRPIRNFNEIHPTYNSTSYSKAAGVIRMFELMVSPKTFQNALHNYLKDGQKLQSGVTTPRNLFDAFDQQVELDSVSHLPPHVSASDIMKTWIENAGYPVINVVRSYDSRDIVITQTPFKPISPLKRVKNDQKWIVPLTFTTKSEQQFSNLEPSHWSFADEPTIISGVDNDDWVLFNLKHSGYYRVNYDKQNWQLLISQLTTNYTAIHPLNRAQLVSDAVALFLDGKLEFAILFSLLEYIKDETNIVPLYSASRWVQELSYKYQSSGRLSATFNFYLRELFTKPFANIGCNVSSTDDNIVKILKPDLLSFMKNFGLECNWKNGETKN